MKHSFINQISVWCFMADYEVERIITLKYKQLGSLSPNTKDKVDQSDFKAFCNPSICFSFKEWNEVCFQFLIRLAHPDMPQFKIYSWRGKITESTSRGCSPEHHYNHLRNFLAV